MSIAGGVVGYVLADKWGGVYEVTIFTSHISSHHGPRGNTGTVSDSQRTREEGEGHLYMDSRTAGRSSTFFSVRFFLLSRFELCEGLVN